MTFTLQLLLGVGSPLVYESYAWLMAGASIASMMLAEFCVIYFNQKMYERNRQPVTFRETLARISKYPLQNLSLDSIASKQPDANSEAPHEPHTPQHVMSMVMATTLTHFKTSALTQSLPSNLML